MLQISYYTVARAHIPDMAQFDVKERVPQRTSAAGTCSLTSQLCHIWYVYVILTHPAWRIPCLFAVLTLGQ